MSLNLQPNLADPDAFYQTLIAAHDGLSDEDSQALNARLVLILANHIGDLDTLTEALKAAKVTE
jgi:predicted metalloendopeptidase